jgi:molybdenum ABC transporter ATP-binding protein
LDADLAVRFRHRLTRLELDVELEVGRETLALVGPSAAGKSSVLRTVAGLLSPDHGQITLGGRMLLDTGGGVDVTPDGRRVGLVFQDGALFPHLTVAQNVAYGLPNRRRRAQPAEAHRLLERFGIAHLAGARPRSLSGGERQRVALVRAVASDPQALLLDEPLSALDPATKGAVAHELGQHLRSLRLPAILVSHDFTDVAALADRIAVMESGHIVQRGTSAELLQAPVSPFVAALTGVNYFSGTAVPRPELTEVRSTAGVGLFLSLDRVAGPVGVVVYPWDVALSATPPGGSAMNALTGAVSRVVTVGNRVRVTLASDPPVVAEITEGSARRLGVATGTKLVATWKAAGTRLVPAADPAGWPPNLAEPG